MGRLLFTFADAEVAGQFDLTRLGPVTGGTDDGLQVIVEPEDDWMTAEVAQIFLLAFGLHGRAMVTAAPEYLDEDGR